MGVSRIIGEEQQCRGVVVPLHCNAIHPETHRLRGKVCKQKTTKTNHRNPEAMLTQRTVLLLFLYFFCPL